MPQQTCKKLRTVLSTLFLCLFLVPCAVAQTDVLTQHNDNMRTGQNTTETILTPSNVKSTTFGKLFALSVDGYVYAQPLYKSNVSISGVTHNIIYVATENDTVYALDADNSGATSAPLWQASLIDTAHGATPGETPVSTPDDNFCTDLVPQIGITSTPVIDAQTGTIYVEAESKLADGVTFIHRIHTLDMTTGAERSPGPVEIAATVPGSSDGGNAVTFDPLHQLNRPGLLLVNGTVYLGFASSCDIGPYHGWIFAYDAATLALRATYVTTPNESQGEGGIWMSGAGLSADSNANIFASTGNGSFDGTTDFGDSILKLVMTGNTMILADSFTPFDQSSLDNSDTDLGSGGVLLLPDQTGSHPHELLEAGKGGTIFLIDRDQMTTNDQHYCSNCSNDPQIVEELPNTLAGLFGMPAYWNNTVYFWGSYYGVSDVLQAYSLNNGLLSSTPTSTSTTSLGFPGATPSISANGNTNAIVWAIDSTKSAGPGPAVLHAFDATNVANELWNSSLDPNNRDTAGNAVKFTVPTIANGKVYIGNQYQITVYGLLTSTLQVHVSSVSLDPTAVTGGTSSTGTVMLSGAAPTGGAVVSLSSDNTAVATTLASVTIAAGTTTATFTVSTSAVGTTSAATITATYNGMDSKATLVVTAVPSGDFSIAIAPSSQAALQGDTDMFIVSVESGGDFNKSVNLTCSAPAGVTCTISSTSVQAPGLATVTAEVSGTVAPGPYSLTIIGTNGSTNHSQRVQMSVGTLTSTVSPDTSATINVGANTNFTVSLNSTNGASGSVSLGCAGLAPGLMCTINPAQVAVPASGSVTTVLTVAVQVKPVGSSIHNGSPDLPRATASYYFAAWSLALAVLLLMTRVLMIHGREDAGPAPAANGVAMIVLLVLAVGLVSCGSPAGTTGSGHSAVGGGSNAVTTQFTLQGQSGTATLNLSTMSITVP